MTAQGSPHRLERADIPETGQALARDRAHEGWRGWARCGDERPLQRFVDAAGLIPEGMVGPCLRGAGQPANRIPGFGRVGEQIQSFRLAPSMAREDFRRAQR